MADPTRQRAAELRSVFESVADESTVVDEQRRPRDAVTSRTVPSTRGDAVDTTASHGLDDAIDEDAFDGSGDPV